MLKIASIQTDIIWENSLRNKIHYDDLLKEIQQVDLIIFPEMFTTGFSMNQKKIAEKPDGETVFWMQQHAKTLNTCIIGSIAVNENNHFTIDYMSLSPMKLNIMTKDIFFQWLWRMKITLKEIRI